MEMNPSIVISAVAIVVSILSFVYTWRRDRAQTKRWKAQNSAQLAIVDVYLQAWREIPIEAKDMDWGFEPDALPAVNDNGIIRTDRLRVVWMLVARHKKTEQILDGTNAITVSELQAELVSRRLPKNDYEFLKWYRVNVAWENIGSTPASDVRCSLKMAEEDSDDFTHEVDQKSRALHVRQKYWSTINWFAPLTYKLPDNLEFEATVEFVDSDHQEHKKLEILIYDRRVYSFRIVDPS